MKRTHDIALLIDPLVKEFRSDETKIALRIFGCTPNEKMAKDIKELCQLAELEEDLSVAITTEFGEELNPSDEGANLLNEEFTLKILKSSSQGYYFFTREAFAEYLLEPDALEDHSFLKLGFTDAAFFTKSFSFLPLKEEYVEREIHSKVDTIKHIKPLNAAGQDFLTTDISKWQALESSYLLCDDVWCQISSKKLLCCLGMEFSILNDSLNIDIVGDRRKKLMMSLSVKTNRHFFSLVNDISSWIYFQSSDIDSRHNIFNYELNKLMPDECILVEQDLKIELLKTAFENGKLVYRYHLNNSSKELSKTLIDLNKSLFEYISKIRQNTVDLISTLWRDFATSFGVVILNFTLKKTDISPIYFKYFGIALCCYLLISFSLTSSINVWFYNNLVRSLREWRSKIYGYINDVDFKKYTLAPLRRAQKRYYFTFWVVLCLYVLIILSIMQLILNVDIISMFNSSKKS